MSISAEVIAHSISKSSNKEIITFELEYPRIIHSEFMTHRMFSRNAASSRAIPIDKLIQQVQNNLAKPSEYGLNEKGMQASERHPDTDLCDLIWKNGSMRAILTAHELQQEGLHKQICNRPLETFQYIKVVVTATEWDNFFYLRNHEDADPTIEHLAEEMELALSASTPQVLEEDEWHTPYVEKDMLGYYTIDSEANKKIYISQDDALKISASCCAQVSYRLLDQSLDKALKIYDQLVTSKPIHASPFEHQAKPMKYSNADNEPWSNTGSYLYTEGVTHITQKGEYWSGNFQGWIQHRQLIPNHNYTKEENR